jgi:hypothetical protein
MTASRPIWESNLFEPLLPRAPLIIISYLFYLFSTIVRSKGVQDDIKEKNLDERKQQQMRNGG